MTYDEVGYDMSGVGPRLVPAICQGRQFNPLRTILESGEEFNLKKSGVEGKCLSQTPASIVE